MDQLLLCRLREAAKNTHSGGGAQSCSPLPQNTPPPKSELTTLQIVEEHSDDEYDIYSLDLLIRVNLLWK